MKLSSCEVQGSVICKYKRNLKPYADEVGCGYDGPCPYKRDIEVNANG